MLDHHLNVCSAGHGCGECGSVQVLDRFRVILDIFADRARTTEAKLQVGVAVAIGYLVPQQYQRSTCWSGRNRYRMYVCCGQQARVRHVRVLSMFFNAAERIVGSLQIVAGSPGPTH